MKKLIALIFALSCISAAQIIQPDTGGGTATSLNISPAPTTCGAGVSSTGIDAVGNAAGCFTPPITNAGTSGQVAYYAADGTTLSGTADPSVNSLTANQFIFSGTWNLTSTTPAGACTAPSIGSMSQCAGSDGLWHFYPASGGGVGTEYDFLGIDKTATKTSGNLLSFDANGQAANAGFAASNAARLDTTNSFAAASSVDLSAVTAVTGFKVPSIAGATPAADAEIVFDSTGRDYRGFVNGANATFMVGATGALPAAGVLPKSASATTGANIASSITDNGKTISSSEVAQFGNHLVVASDFTTAASTALQTITGLSWTSPVSLAATVSFHCSFNFSQATGTAAVAFGIQGATTAPTSISANGVMWAGASGAQTTSGTLTNLTTTTATNVISGTPSAITTVWMAQMDGTAALPSNASPTVLNFMVSTATSGDAVTVKRGSYCELF